MKGSTGDTFQLTRGKSFKNQFKGNYPKLTKKVKDDLVTFYVKLRTFSKEPT